MSTYWLKYRGTRFPVRRGETIVGRSAYCTIVLSNRLASRQHCALTLTPDGLSIADLGSSNGTSVNGERVEDTRKLEVGDVIRIGTDLLEVMDGEGSPPSRGKHPTNPYRESVLAEEAATGIHECTLDLAEALAASAAQTQNPTGLVAPIQRAVDAIVERSARSNDAIPRVTVARLRAVIESISAWYPARDLDSWRASVLEAIERQAQT